MKRREGQICDEGWIDGVLWVRNTPQFPVASVTQGDEGMARLSRRLETNQRWMKEFFGIAAEWRDYSLQWPCQPPG